MRSSLDPNLPERLAELLLAAASRLTTAAGAQHLRLAELNIEIAALEAGIDPAENLRNQADALAAALADRGVEQQRLEEARATVNREEHDLDAALDAVLGPLSSRCGELVTRLPSLTADGASRWAAWLVAWHRDHGVAFDDAGDWQAYFAALRHGIADALEDLEPTLALLHQIEIPTDAGGIAYAEVADGLESARTSAAALDGSFLARRAAIGQRYGRIVDDLPTPPPDGSLSQLHQITQLLAYLDKTLARFAVSARVETQMLEGLQ